MSEMHVDFRGGGAFADILYAQYPEGLGRGPVPAFVREAREKLRHLAGETPSSTFPDAVSLQKMMKNNNNNTAPSGGALVVAASPSAPVSLASGNLQEDVTAKAKEALEAKLAEKITRRTESEMDFSGQHIARVNAKQKTDGLVIVTSSGANVALEQSTGIVRSPTKKKKSVFDMELEKQKEGTMTSSHSLASGENDKSDTIDENISVPFCVSDWQNKKNLIVPVEQRLANRKDERRNLQAVGNGVIDLAKAMRKGAVQVEEMIRQKEREREAEQERERAEEEQREAARARELLEEKAKRELNASRRTETREERLQRIKVERELRERERVERQRQQHLARAAARLNVSVEDLEADEQLLRTVEEAEVKPHLLQGLESSSSLGHAAPAGPASIYDDEIDRNKSQNSINKSVLKVGVISNEGIKREMEALEASDAITRPAEPLLRPREEEDSDSEEDDEDAINVASLKKKRRF